MGLLSAIVKLPGNIVKTVVDDVSGKNNQGLDVSSQGAALCSFGISSALKAIKKTSDEEL